MTTLIVDDDDALRSMLLQAFELEDMNVIAEADPIEALKRIDRSFPGVVITDVRMPGMDGPALFRRLQAIDPEIPVILMTGHGDVPMVIDAMKGGVFDFITKPFSADHLIVSARRAIELRSLVLENRKLKSAISIADTSEPLIGETTVMVRLRETIRQLAHADIDVLVQGETGTGKELVASLLHRWGGRRGKPFVAVNCAALPQGIAEPELFGHAPGALAQYRWGQTGRIEASDGGTLFLDEVGSMPLPIQGAFLRVLEEREVRQIGAERSKPINLRVVAASNSNFSDAVDRGEFRNDLFYRLNTVPLFLPPLRERRADIPLLFAHFANEASQRFELEFPAIDGETYNYLTSHSWPGNVRELKNYAQRVVLGLQTFDGHEQAESNVGLTERVAQFEAAVIRRSLEQSEGDVQTVLADLKLARNTFYDKLKRYNIQAQDFRIR